MRWEINSTLVFEVIENSIKVFIYSRRVMVVPVMSIGVRGCLGAIVYDGETFQVHWSSSVCSCSIDRRIIVYDADPTAVR